MTEAATRSELSTGRTTRLVALVKVLFVSFDSTTALAGSATALSWYVPESRGPMFAVTVAEAPAARAPTEAEPTFVPLSRRSTVLAGAASAPALRTVADTVIASDSTGDAGLALTAVTWRSGLGAGSPRIWNSATWPAPEPVLELNFSWTSATRAPTGMVTELPVPGVKV